MTDTANPRRTLITVQQALNRALEAVLDDIDAGTNAHNYADLIDTLNATFIATFDARTRTRPRPNRYTYTAPLIVSDAPDAPPTLDHNTGNWRTCGHTTTGPAGVTLTHMHPMAPP